MNPSSSPASSASSAPHPPQLLSLSAPQLPNSTPQPLDFRLRTHPDPTPELLSLHPSTLSDLRNQPPQPFQPPHPFPSEAPQLPRPHQPPFIPLSPQRQAEDPNTHKSGCSRPACCRASDSAPGPLSPAGPSGPGSKEAASGAGAEGVEGFEGSLDVER